MTSAFPNIDEFLTTISTDGSDKVGIRGDTVRALPEEVGRASLSLPLAQEVLIRISRCLDDLKPWPFSVYVFTGILGPLFRSDLTGVVVDEHLLMGMTRFLVRFRTATKENKFNEQQVNDLEGLTFAIISGWCRADAAARRPAAAFLREHGLNSTFAHLSKSNFLASLLELLEDETILVIDTVTQRSMQVQISNISLTVQLSILIQHHLRLQYDANEVEVPEGWCPVVRKKVLHQADGSSPQSAVSHRDIPWDLLDHTAVVKPKPSSTPEHQQKDTFRYNRDINHWIWNEGIPADIPPCAALDGMRVVLLGPPSYPRHFNFSRVFEKLVPKFQIVKFFGADETADFLKRIAAESTTLKPWARSGEHASGTDRRSKPSRQPEADDKAPSEGSDAPAKKRWRQDKGWTLGSPRRKLGLEIAAAVNRRPKPPP